jgi:hypothetical protein
LKVNSLFCWFLFYGYVAFFTVSSLLIYTLHSYTQNSDTSPCIGLIHNIQNGLKRDENVTSNSVVRIWFNFLLLIFDNYVFRHPWLIAVTAVILINVEFLSLCTVHLPTNIFTLLSLVMPTHLHIFINEVLFKIIFSTVITPVYIVIATLTTYIYSGVSNQQDATISFY